MEIFFGLISAVAAVIAAYFGTVQFLDGRPYIADTRCLMLRDGFVLYVQIAVGSVQFRIKSVSVDGMLLGQPTNGVHKFGLHLVHFPPEESFVKELPIDVVLDPIMSPLPRELFFICKPTRSWTPADSLRINIRMSRWVRLTKTIAIARNS